MKKILLILICVAVFGLTSCGNDNITLNTQAQAEDPFVTVENAVNNSITVGSFGVKSDLFEETTFSGQKIQANQLITNREVAINLGFLTLIDGIPQVDLHSGSIVPRVYLNAYEIHTLPLEFVPSHGKQGEILRMDTLSIFQPDFVPEGDNFTFGHFQNAMAGLPIKVIFDTTVQEREFTVYKEQTVRNPTDSENEFYNLVDGNVTVFRLAQNGNTDYLTTQKNSISFEFLAYAMDSETYRISLYKNHQPVEINGYDVADIELIKGRVTEISINLDDVKPSDFLYAIAVPLTNNMFTATKTTTMKVMENDFTIKPEDDSASYINEQTIETPSSNSLNSIVFISADDDSTFFCEAIDENSMRIIRKDQNNQIIASSDSIDANNITNFSSSVAGFSFIKMNIGKASSIITLDNELQNIRYYDLQEIGVSHMAMRSDCLDICDNKLLFKNIDGNICIYDLSTMSTTVFPNNESINPTEKSLVSIQFLSEQEIAFVSQTYQPISYSIGVLDLSANKIVQKPLDSISTSFDTSEGIACWYSKRMDEAEVSDGIIHIYYDNKFHEIVCENKNENQNVFLSNDGKQLATYYADKSKLIVSVYDVKNGEKTFEKEIELDKNCNPYSTVLCISGDKIYVYNNSYNQLFEMFQLRS